MAQDLNGLSSERRKRSSRWRQSPRSTRRQLRRTVHPWVVGAL